MESGGCESGQPCEVLEGVVDDGCPDDKPLPHKPAHRQQDHITGNRNPANAEGVLTGDLNLQLRFIPHPSANPGFRQRNNTGENRSCCVRRSLRGSGT